MSKRITAILLTLIMLLGILPLTALAEDAAYTITITADTAAGKTTLAGVEFYVNGHNPKKLIGQIDTPLNITSKTAEKMQFRVNAPDDMGNVLGVEMIIDEQSIKKVISDVPDSENPLTGEGVFSKITIKDNGILNKVYLYFNNADSAMTDLMTDKNITIKFLYDNASLTEDQSVGITTLTSDEQKGSAYAVWQSDNDDDSTTYLINATPGDGYMLDYWEYSTDGGNSWCDEADRIVNDVENSAAATTVTLTEDRVYRAVFKPAQFILGGDYAAVCDSGLSSAQAKFAYASGYRIGSASSLPSEAVREGAENVFVSYYFNVPSNISIAYTAAVSLYTGTYTDGVLTAGKDSFFTKAFSSISYGPSPNRKVTLLIDEIPYMDTLIVEMTLTDPDGNFTVSRREYGFEPGKGVIKDTASAARAEALENLAAYYTENFAETVLETINANTGHKDTERDETRRELYNSFAAVRYLLRYAYEDAYIEIKEAAVTAEDVTAAYNAAIARFGEYVELNTQINAGNGDYYKNIDGVIKVLYLVNNSWRMSSKYAYVPADSVVRDAMEAAFESNNPGGWKIEGGGFVTGMSPDGGNGKVIAGGTSSQIVYSQNHAYALGVGSQEMTDRDVLIFGFTIDADQYPMLANLPDKDELAWALGVLSEKYDASALEADTAYVNAVAAARLWGINPDTSEGMNSYPADLAAAQSVVDNALAALKAAYPEVDFTRYSYPEAVLNVMSLISAIGDVGPSSGDAITAARDAYDALGEADKAQVPNYAALEAAEAAYDLLSADTSDASAVLNEALTAQQDRYNAAPATGSIGGEWAALGIARGGMPLTDTEIKYLGQLNALIIDSGGVDGISTNKYTEYSRIILALSSLGIDAQTYSYAGTSYDFVSKLTEYDNVAAQGINGAIFALIALDTKPYLPGNTEIRDKYVSTILDSQLTGGGWALSGGDADADVTAQALQALANYRGMSGVSSAIDKGTAALKGMQDTTHGGFYSWEQYNSESAAQVIVALTALGIDPTGDDWTENGDKNPVTALLTFYNGDGKMFRHTLTGGSDAMATEQAVYALIALDRYNTGANSLYDMSDMFAASPEPGEETVEKTGLREAINAAVLLTEGGYTADTWAALQTALTAAQTVRDNADATQEDADNAKTALLTAVSDLEYGAITANKGVLNAAIAIGGGLAAADYVSYEDVTAALPAADAAAADAEAAQEDVDTAAGDLLDALEALGRAANAELLDAAIAAAETADALTEADYTAATWAAYTTALADANAVEAGAAQDDITFAAQSLIAAVGALEATEGAEDDGAAEYAKVTASLEAIKAALTEASYTEAAWTALSAAAEKEALANALTGLELGCLMDDAGIRLIIAQAETLTEADYTEASYEPLSAALNARMKLAQEVYEDQSEIDADSAAIVAAIRGLALPADTSGANKILLNSLISRASVLQQASYTAETWTALQTALTAAQTVKGDGEAAQEEVEAAIDGLLAAVGQLEASASSGTPVDKDELNSTIESASQITNTGKGYTTASWNSLQTALIYAREISESADATQEQVNSAARDLRTAVTGLTEYSDTGAGDELPDDPTSTYAILSVTDPNAKAGQKSTYYPATELELRQGETAYSILGRTALKLRVSTHHLYAGIYVEAIDDFGEFDDGPYSGWMYKVNGVFPNYSSSLYELADGDVVEWVYTRDLGEDVGGGWNSEPGGGVLGENTKLTPAAVAANGVASVTLSADDLDNALKDAKDNGSGAVVIEPKITGTARKVTVELPKSFLSSAASDTDADLTIETPVGSMTIPNEVLDFVASQASGGTVIISLDAINASALTAAQQAAAGDDPVYDISILSGNTHIPGFGGGSITISLPYTLKNGETGENVTVWYLNDKGGLEKTSCTYDGETGLATFTTDHLSLYAVGYDEWVNPFADVKSTDWFYTAVKFTARNKLFEGTTPATFAPDADMTRAMLVSVLYRLDGRPAVIGTNSFADVGDGEWYTDAVIWADANNIAGGYGSGQFGTADSVTREQMAAILYNYAKYKGYDITASADLSTYADAAGISSWALAAMKWTNAEGLVTGRTATTIAPSVGATRAEVAELLMRFTESIAE